MKLAPCDIPPSMAVAVFVWHLVGVIPSYPSSNADNNEGNKDDTVDNTNENNDNNGDNVNDKDPMF